MKVLVVEIKLVSNGGVLNPADLPTLGERVREAVAQRGWDALWAISGRMPVWAYAFLTHLLHPAQGVATYEPRSAGFIVVSRHSDRVPAEGTLIPEKGDEEKVEVVI